MSFSTPHLFSIQNVAADLKQQPSSSIYEDNHNRSQLEIRQLISDFDVSEQTYAGELSSLASLLNNFDLRFNNYYDDSLRDATDDMIEVRRLQTKKLVSIVSTLLAEHDKLAIILNHHDTDVSVVKFSEWCINIIPTYASYIKMYKLNTNQSKTEIHLRRRPLVRIRYLNKFVLNLKELINYQVEQPQTCELLSNLEIAHYKLSQNLNEARKVDELQRAKIHDQVHLNNVKSLTELSLVSTSFDPRSIIKAYPSELHYTNSDLDVTLNFDKMEILFLSNMETNDLHSIALVTNEDYGRSMVFPPLRANELTFVKQVESTVFQFCSAYDENTNVYLKIDRKSYDIRDELLAFFPGNNENKSNKQTTQITNKLTGFSRSSSLGLGISVPQRDSSLESMEDIVFTSEPLSKMKSMEFLRSGVSNKKKVGSKSHIYQQQEVGAKSVPNLSEPRQLFTYRTLAPTKTVQPKQFSGGLGIAQASNTSTESKLNKNEREFNLAKEKLRQLSIDEAPAKIADSENFDPEILAKSFQLSHSNSSSSTLSTLDPHAKKKTRRQSIFNVFSGLMGKRKEDITDKLSTALARAPQLSTSDLKGPLISKQQPVTRMTPELESLLSHNTQLFIQRTRNSRWLNTNKWSDPVDVDLKLIKTESDNFLVGFTTSNALSFIAKLNSSTTIRRSASLNLHVTSVDHNNNQIILLLTSPDCEKLERLHNILSFKKNGPISNSSSQDSALSFVSMNTSLSSMHSNEYLPTRPVELKSVRSNSKLSIHTSKPTSRLALSSPTTNVNHIRDQLK